MQIIAEISDAEAILRVCLDRGLSFLDLANKLNISVIELRSYLWRVNLNNNRDPLINLLEEKTGIRLSSFMLRKMYPTIGMSNLCPHCGKRIIEESNSFKIIGSLKIVEQICKIDSYDSLKNIIQDCNIKYYPDMPIISGNIKVENKSHKVDSFEDLQNIFLSL